MVKLLWVNQIDYSDMLYLLKRSLDKYMPNINNENWINGMNLSKIRNRDNKARFIGVILVSLLLLTHSVQ